MPKNLVSFQDAKNVTAKHFCGRGFFVYTNLNGFSYILGADNSFHMVKELTWTEVRKLEIRQKFNSRKNANEKIIAMKNQGSGNLRKRTNNHHEKPVIKKNPTHKRKVF